MMFFTRNQIPTSCVVLRVRLRSVDATLRMTADGSMTFDGVVLLLVTQYDGGRDTLHYGTEISMTVNESFVRNDKKAGIGTCFLIYSFIYPMGLFE